MIAYLTKWVRAFFRLCNTINIQTLIGPRQVISICLPLWYEVDEKINQSIWQDKYVELSLSANIDQDDDYDLHLNPRVGSIPFKHKQRPIKSVIRWCDIMYTYQATMLEDEVRSKDMPLFLNYIKDVRSICNEGWDWAFCNEQYRKYRGGSTNPEPWSVHRLDLYNTACHRALMQQRASFYQQPFIQSPFGKRQSAYPIDSQANTPAIPKGFCFAYHSPSTRTRLKYSFRHLCYMCSKGEHPGILCHFTRPQAMLSGAVQPNMQPSFQPRHFGYYGQPQSDFRMSQGSAGQQQQSVRSYNPVNAFKQNMGSGNTHQSPLF